MTSGYAMILLAVTNDATIARIWINAQRSLLRLRTQERAYDFVILQGRVRMRLDVNRIASEA